MRHLNSEKSSNWRSSIYLLSDFFRIRSSLSKPLRSRKTSLNSPGGEWNKKLAAILIYFFFVLFLLIKVKKNYTIISLGYKINHGFFVSNKKKELTKTYIGRWVTKYLSKLSFFFVAPFQNFTLLVQLLEF